MFRKPEEKYIRRVTENKFRKQPTENVMKTGKEKPFTIKVRRS